MTKKEKGNYQVLGILGAVSAAAYFIFPSLMRELDKMQSFISQKITKFSVGGLTMDNGVKVKFVTSLEIANKNEIGFPIQDLAAKLFYKAGTGQLVEVGRTVPNFQKYLIPGAKNGVKGVAKIENIEFLIDPKKIPGLVNGIFQLAKGFEFQVQSDLKVYNVEVSTITPFKL